jgi:hypothetical protein
MVASGLITSLVEALHGLRADDNVNTTIPVNNMRCIPNSNPLNVPPPAEQQ